MTNTKTCLLAALALPMFMAGAAQAQTTSAPAVATPAGPATNAPGAAPMAPNAPASSSMAQPPAATGMTASGSGADLSAADRKFIDKAAIGGLAEVEVAKMVEQKTDDATVKQFAQKMIDDHTPNNEQLTKLAESKGVTPPTELDAMHQKQMSKLEALSGKKLDTTYLKEQEKDHAVMLKLFKTEAKNGQDPELKQFAETTIPVIEQHEALAKTDMK